MQDDRHGEKELNCLNNIKKQFGKIDFNKLTQDDISTIKNAFIFAKPNPQSSVFPDFILENGFIEHFEVTAAKMKKGSSEYRKKASFFENKTCKDNFQQLHYELENNIKPGYMMVQNNTMTYEENTYENYINSFKRNFLHHIDSLEKFNGEKELGIFLVEMAGGSMGTFYYDQTRPSHPYHIYWDKAILNFLESYTNKIKYIIFYNHDDNIDIIDLSLIEKYKDSISDYIRIEPGRMTKLNSQIAMNIDFMQVFTWMQNHNK